MIIYNYSPITKEYLGVSFPDESPLEPGIFLIPANATITPPPIVPEGSFAVFENNIWNTRQILIETLTNPTTPVTDPKVLIITAKQARLQLLAINKLDDVELVILSLSRIAQIEWEYSETIHRYNPLVLEMQGIMLWTDVQMDEFFILASLL